MCFIKSIQRTLNRDAGKEMENLRRAGRSSPYGRITILGLRCDWNAWISWLTHPVSLPLDDVSRPTAGYLPQRFKTALVTASRTASCRIAH